MGIYLKIDGIEGNATHADHKGWIDISSLRYSVDRNVNDVRLGACDNREGGQPKISDIYLSKKFDKSSINILKFILSGDKAKEMKIHQVSTGNPGAAYLEFILENAIISSYDFRTSSDYMPEESFTLNFIGYKEKFIEHDGSNSPKSPIITGYNLATCKVY